MRFCLKKKKNTVVNLQHISNYSILKAVTMTDCRCMIDVAQYSM